MGNRRRQMVPIARVARGFFMTPLDRWLPRIVLAAALVVCGLECSAEAQPARVDAETVCAVHRAISHRKPLRHETCATIASALNETPDPVRMLALAVNESGTRPEAIRVHVRPDGLVAYDAGILQTRCLVDPTRKDTVCLNGPAKGLTVERLLNAQTNIRTAWAVYEMHGRDPGRYNGATGKRAKRYRQRIEAIEAALMGMTFVAPDKRTRGLCKRIVEAMGKEPRS
jgi:hypothetical protein